MRKSRIGFAFVALLFLGIVVSAVKDLDSVKQFDAQYGAILQELGPTIVKALNEREATPDLYALCEQELTKLKAIPRTNNEVRETLRYRLGSALTGVTQLYRDQPFEARTDEVLGKLHEEVMDLNSCLQQGIAHSDTTF